jgi:hypothetical protein
LVNFQLMTNKMILSANIILVVAFLAMFTVFSNYPCVSKKSSTIGFWRKRHNYSANSTSIYDCVFIICALFWIYNFQAR